MRQLQNAFIKTMQDIPRLSVQRLLQSKISEIGRELPEKVAIEWSKLVIRGEVKSLHWNDEAIGEDANIELTNDDLQKLTENLEVFFRPENISDLVETIAIPVGTKIARRLVQHVSDEEYGLRSGELLFQINLIDRWGPAMARLKAMIVFSQEVGLLKFEAGRRRKRNRCRRIALARLHARACQVSCEILTLLQAGYADGAMARWRTLHEIAVISLVLVAGNEELAQRFVDHEAIDAKQSLDEFMTSQVPVGAKPPSKKTLERSSKAVDALVAKYGQDYKKPYGWAANHLGRSKVTFRDLEQAADRSASRWAYKLASFNVHTSPRTFVFSFSSSDEAEMILAGASNRGLDEPGIRAAADLAVVTCNLFEKNFTLDDLVAMHVMVFLRDDAKLRFSRTARALNREIRSQK